LGQLEPTESTKTFTMCKCMGHLLTSLQAMSTIMSTTIMLGMPPAHTFPLGGTALRTTEGYKSLLLEGQLEVQERGSAKWAPGVYGSPPMVISRLCGAMESVCLTPCVF
jgi:hypothetical protein